MQLAMIHDLSVPDFGAPQREIYAAVLDMCAWADDVGFDAIGLGEHHGSPDGYDPSPIVAAAAIAVLLLLAGVIGTSLMAVVAERARAEATSALEDRDRALGAETEQRRVADLARRAERAGWHGVGGRGQPADRRDESPACRRA